MRWSAAIACSVLVVAACTPPSPAGGGSVLPAGAAPVEVIEALGRHVILAQPPRRIAIAGKAGTAIAEAAYLFPEASSRVALLVDSTQGRGSLIAVVDPTLASKIVIRHDAHVEQLAAAGVDLVILKSYLAATVGEPLVALGLPVVYVDLETPEQYARDLLILGRVFANEARATELAAWYQGRLERVATALSGVEERPEVLLLYASDRDGSVAFKVPPSGWMQTRLTELAGGRPVWLGANPGGGWAQVTLEQVAAWDADHIVVISYVKDAAEVVAALQVDPHWRAMRAVREGRLVPFPGDFVSWDQPTTRWILGLTWLAWRLHPERFPTMDVVGEARELFATLYRLDQERLYRWIVPSLSSRRPAVS